MKFRTVPDLNGYRESILKEVDLEGEIVLIKLSFFFKNIVQNDNNKLYFDGKKVVVKKEA